MCALRCPLEIEESLFLHTYSGVDSGVTMCVCVIMVVMYRPCIILYCLYCLLNVVQCLMISLGPVRGL